MSFFFLEYSETEQQYLYHERRHYVAKTKFKCRKKISTVEGASVTTKLASFLYILGGGERVRETLYTSCSLQKTLQKVIIQIFTSLPFDLESMIVLLAINKNYFLTKCPLIDDIVLQKHNLNAFFIPSFAKFIVVLIQGAKAWRSIGAQLLPSVLLFSNFQRPFDKSILKHQHTGNTAAKW